MINLIKLEFDKYKPGKNRSIIITHLILLGLLLIMLFSSNADEEYLTWDDFVILVDVLVRSTFIIYSSVIMAKLVVGEFETRTIYQLFSYPIARWKLMISKIIIVLAFTSVNIIIGNIFNLIILSLVNNIYNLIPGTLTFSLLSGYTMYYLSGFIVSCLIALVPFTVSMYKKKTSTTIISSVIIVVLTVSSSGSGFTVTDYIVRAVFVGSICLAVTAFSLTKLLKNIDDIDIA